jgi:hypothetical protein
LEEEVQVEEVIQGLLEQMVVHQYFQQLLHPEVEEVVLIAHLAEVVNLVVQEVEVHMEQLQVVQELLIKDLLVELDQM